MKQVPPKKGPKRKKKAQPANPSTNTNMNPLTWTPTFNPQAQFKPNKSWNPKPHNHEEKKRHKKQEIKNELERRNKERIRKKTEKKKTESENMKRKEQPIDPKSRKHNDGNPIVAHLQANAWPSHTKQTKVKVRRSLVPVKRR